MSEMETSSASAAISEPLLNSQSTRPIDLENHELVMHWCDRFAISEAQLSAAVARVGVMPGAVEYLLRSRSGSLMKVVDEATRARINAAREERIRRTRFTPGPAQLKRDPR